jgi:hypothetical protein
MGGETKLKVNFQKLGSVSKRVLCVVLAAIIAFVPRSWFGGGEALAAEGVGALNLSSSEFQLILNEIEIMKAQGVLENIIKSPAQYVQNPSTEWLETLKSILADIQMRASAAKDALANLTPQTAAAVLALTAFAGVAYYAVDWEAYFTNPIYTEIRENLPPFIMSPPPNPAIIQKMYEIVKFVLGSGAVEGVAEELYKFGQGFLDVTRTAWDFWADKIGGIFNPGEDVLMGIPMSAALSLSGTDIWVTNSNPKITLHLYTSGYWVGNVYTSSGLGNVMEYGFWGDGRPVHRTAPSTTWYYATNDSGAVVAVYIEHGYVMVRACNPEKQVLGYGMALALAPADAFAAPERPYVYNPPAKAADTEKAPVIAMPSLPDAVGKTDYQNLVDLAKELVPGSLTWDETDVIPGTKPGEEVKEDDKTGELDKAKELDKALEDVIADTKIDFKPLSEGWSGIGSVFPFCLPFDLINMFSGMEAVPEPPKIVFESPLKAINPDWAKEPITLDLAPFEPAAAVVRTFVLGLWVLGLIFATGKVIKW